MKGWYHSTASWPTSKDSCEHGAQLDAMVCMSCPIAQLPDLSSAPLWRCLCGLVKTARNTCKQRSSYKRRAQYIPEVEMCYYKRGIFLSYIYPFQMPASDTITSSPDQPNIHIAVRRPASQPCAVTSNITHFTRRNTSSLSACPHRNRPFREPDGRSAATRRT